MPKRHWIDEAEYITPENSRRIKELNLTEEDLLDGYYIYNPDEETKEYLLTPDTVYYLIVSITEKPMA